MKKITNLLGLLLIAFIMIRCSSDDDQVAPDLEEEISVEDVAGDSEMEDNFSFKGTKSNESTSGYDVDGTLYIETESGQITVMEGGNFSVTLDSEGNMSSMEGEGPVQIPDLGMFKDFNLEDDLEGTFIYNTGKYFKETNDSFKELPLRDNYYYFFFNLINNIPGIDPEIKVKNARMGGRNFFLNLSEQEFVLAAGSFEVDIPGAGSYSIGNELAIGIAAKKSFQFEPQVFEDSTLNAVITEQEAFENISGFMYLAGAMSIKKLPLGISGTAVIDADFDVVFSEGLSSGDVTLAMNGKLKFGHELLDLLPYDFETELTNVTLKYNQWADNTNKDQNIKFAGQFDDNAWMETIVDEISGQNISQYIPFTGAEGSMFASFGEDWDFYVNTYGAINTPHLGKQSTKRIALRINSEQTAISTGLAIPFIPGELAASGVFDYDGGVLLQAKANTDLTIKNFSLKADLDINIDSEAATLTGDVDVPYGLGKVDVAGEISSSGLSFTGTANNKSLDFADGISLPMGAINISANINENDPRLSINGNLTFPQLNDPLINVAGTIDSRGIELLGSINTDLNLPAGSIPLVNMSLEARTWEGVYFDGSTSIPFGIGSASAIGYLTGNQTDNNGFPELMLDLSFASNPTIQFEGFSFPSANLTMKASTVAGLRFNGQVRLGSHIGYLNCSGVITRSAINFTGNYNQSINYGGTERRVLSTNFFIQAGSNMYPNVATAVGSIQTPFGNVSASGVIGLNGNFLFNGNLSGCANLPGSIPGSSRFNAKFTFRQDGIGITASGTYCTSGCGSNSGCQSVETEVNANWGNGRLGLCFTLPFYGETCIDY